jgi:hypothetical protein
MIFSTAASNSAVAERMRITSAGNVGIGYSNPDYPLTVSSINLGGVGANLGIILSNVINTAIPSSSVKAQIGVTNSGFGYAAGSLLLQPRTGVNAVLAFATEGTEKMRLDYLGNFGVGTTSPNLYSWASKTITVASSATNSYAALEAYGNGTGAGALLLGNTSILRASIVGVDGSHLVFATNTANTGSSQNEKMRITSAGNVGIGTTAPTSTLSVQGNTDLGNSIGSTLSSTYTTRISGYALRYDASSRYGNYGVLILNSDSGWTGSARRFMLTSGLNTNKFGIIRSVDASTDPALGDGGVVSSGTADFVITNAGNVGIGTTSPFLVSSAWTTLEVTGQGAGGGGIVYTSNNAGTVRSHYFSDGSGGYIGTQTNHFFSLGTNNTERMRITSAGELLINTTTDSGDYKLQVNGNSYTSGSAVVGNLHLGQTIVYGNTYFNYITGGSAGWVKVGTLNIPQGGHNAYIRFYSGSGYNANNSQNGYVELYIRTSNGSSSDAGYYFSAYVQRFGYNSFMTDFRLTANYPTSNDIDVYAYLSVYSGIGFYSVEASPSTSWSNSMTAASAPVSYYAVADIYKVISLATFSNGVDITGNITISGNITPSPNNTYSLGGGSNKWAGIWGARFFADDGSVNAPSYTFAGDQDTGFWKPGDGVLATSTNGVERMRITAAGNVGIGLSTPGAKLDVNGTTQLRDNVYTLGENGIELGWLGSTINDQRIGRIRPISTPTQNPYAGGLAFDYYKYSGTQYQFYEGMRLTGSGNVGIGTTSPSAKLHVAGSNNTAQGLIVTGADPNQGNVAKFVRGDSEKNFYIGATNNSIVNLATEGSFYLKTNVTADQPYTTGTTTMVLTSTGNVGIGTTSPSEKLDVGGAARFLSYGIVQASNNSDVPNITFTNNGGAYTWGIVGALLQGDGDGALYFKTKIGGSVTEKMRITSAGNVGIGTSSPGGKLEIVGSSGGLSLKLPSGEWYGASSSNRMAFDNPNQLFHTALSSGAYKFRNSGDTGDVMTILNTGNGGIGTTAPSYKLQVNGADAGLYVLAASIAPFTQTIATFIYGGNNNSINIENHGGKASIQARDGSSSAMDLHLNPAGGNVGIGMTSPQTKLNVNKDFAAGSTQKDYLRLTASQPGAWFSNIGLQFRWNDFGNGVAWNLASVEGEVDGWSGSNGGGALVFYTKTLGAYANAPTEKMRISAAGNVGIGTSNPTYKLQVNSSAGNYGIINTNGTVAIGTYIEASNYYGSFGTQSNHALGFFTNNSAPQMYLAISGNVGIGTTSPQLKLDIIQLQVVEHNCI